MAMFLAPLIESALDFTLLNALGPCLPTTSSAGSRKRLRTGTSVGRRLSRALLTRMLQIFQLYDHRLAPFDEPVVPGAAERGHTHALI